jgi:transforming growth factor-beta-induced protein
MKLTATTLSLAAGGLMTVAAAPALAGGCDAHKQASHASHRTADIVDTAVAAGSFKTLAAALVAADLADALKGEGPFTVFAPTDEAFAKLPAGTLKTLLKPENKQLLTSILTYHVAAGRYEADQIVARTNLTTLNGQRVGIGIEHGVQIDNANVITADIACSNGVIHVIDRVILPTSESILEIAAEAGSFETLAAAVRTAGLAEVLASDGPYTVFAPTDEAFAKLPAGTVEKLLRPENRQQLIEILKYHVVPGRVYASDALNAETAQTAQGSRVRFSLGDGMMMVNGATVVKTDVEASNGVIHVIDEVILPG